MTLGLRLFRPTHVGKAHTVGLHVDVNANICHPNKVEASGVIYKG